MGVEEEESGGVHLPVVVWRQVVGLVDLETQAVLVGVSGELQVGWGDAGPGAGGGGGGGGGGGVGGG